MATHLVIEAADVSKRGLRDAAAHRQGVSPVYNSYARVGGDPAFAGRQGDYQALLRPLLMLSFLVDDYLAEHEFFGARSVLLSSASSKTAFGLAHLVHTQRKGVQVIGLTSAANVGFRPLARLLRRGRDLRRDPIAAGGLSGRLCRHGRQQRPARAAAQPFRRADEIFRADRAHAPRHRHRTKRHCPAQSRAGSSPPTRSASAPRNGARAASTRASARRGRASRRSSMAGSP